MEERCGQVSQNIARALTAATPAMFTTTRGKPNDADLRRALLRWGYNIKQRDTLPDDVASVLARVSSNTAMVSALAEPIAARQLLDAAITLLNGKTAAPTTARRHRMILANAMDYAMELNLLDGNPVRELKWKAPKVSGGIDRRCVVNPRQARALLEAIAGQQPSGPRLVAFFGVMYYAGLRPEEAVSLRKDDVTLPRDDDWGELQFRNASPDAGGEWTDDGSEREHRQLKHRAAGDERTVPTHPELTSCCGRTSSSSAPPARTDGCSAASPGANCPPSPTGAPRRTRGRSPSPRESRPRRWRGGPTIYGTPAYPPGSTAASPRHRWPSGPDTAWTCCCASTPSASPGRTSWPSGASAKPCEREPVSSSQATPGRAARRQGKKGRATTATADLAAYLPQPAASPVPGRAQPHTISGHRSPSARLSAHLGG